MIRFSIVCFVLITTLFACSFERRNESNLKGEDFDYLKSLELLQPDEEIIMFKSNGGIKGIEVSGNFFTDSRVASYWIDGRNDQINSAYYSEIDSIKLIERTSAITYASYLEIVDTGGHRFNVYIDADSARVWTFFESCVDTWLDIQ